MSKIPSELWPQEFFKNVIRTNEIVKLQIKLLPIVMSNIYDKSAMAAFTELGWIWNFMYESEVKRKKW